METAIDKYIREHSTAQGEALEWIEKQTNLHTNYPQMLSGAVQGRLLTMLVELTGAQDILEIGTFTGYSAVCLAQGLHGQGHIHTLEINDELEDLTREGWRRAGVEELITLHIGDALKVVPELGLMFDMIFLDGEKREYPDYYNTLLDWLRPGGYMIADNTLWDGHVVDAAYSSDPQTMAVKKFNDMVHADARVEVAMIPIRDGLSLIRRIN